MSIPWVRFECYYSFISCSHVYEYLAKRTLYPASLIRTNALKGAAFLKIAFCVSACTCKTEQCHHLSSHMPTAALCNEQASEITSC